MLLTCGIKNASVVISSVDQEVVGGDTKLPAAVLVTAVACDDGVQLHLKTHTHTQLLRRRTDRKVLQMSGRRRLICYLFG